MTQKVVKSLIPFESLFDSVAALSLPEKRRLWNWLAEQIAQAEIREARMDYQISDSLVLQKTMTQTEILTELKKLTPSERLAIIEAALPLPHQDHQQPEQSSTYVERKRQLMVAAEVLFSDYTSGNDLTSFIDLDGEDFHAPG